MPLDYVNIIVTEVLNMYLIASAVFNIQVSHTDYVKNFAAKLNVFWFLCASDSTGIMCNNV
jgi:hypothetical protein